MTCSNCRIVMPLTPKEIKEKYLDSLGNPYDVFALSIGKLTLTGHPSVIPALVDICWRRFKNRPIGDYDYEVWFEALDDKVNDIWYSYKRTIPLFMNSNIASLVTGKETVIENVINARDALTTNNLTESVDNTEITENEDNPDSGAGVLKYLSNRSNVVIDAAKVNTGTVTATDDLTVDRDSTIERTEGLAAVLSLEINDAIREGFDRFLNEIEPLFLNRW